MASITQRGNSFRVLIRRRGEKAICRTFKTRKEAEAFARDAERKSLGVDPTVLEVVEAYRKLRSDSRRPVNPKGNEHYMLEHLVRDLGTEKVAGLTVEKLRQWASWRAKDGSGPYTLNMELSKLGTVLKYAAIVYGHALPDVTPQARTVLNHLHLVGTSGERDRRLEPGEEEKLLTIAPQWMRDLISFALDTAMRRGEIIRLRWDDVDHERRVILIRDRKHPRRKIGNNEIVPLLGTSYHVIKAQKQESDRIFPYSPERVSDTFKLLCDAQGIEDLHFHDLRHEAISRLFERGYSVEQVALVSGHKDWRQLKRYTNLRPESLHQLDADPDTAPRRRSARPSAPAPAKSSQGTPRR